MLMMHPGPGEASDDIQTYDYGEWNLVLNRKECKTAKYTAVPFLWSLDKKIRHALEQTDATT
jgi:hypothetical protein